MKSFAHRRNRQNVGKKVVGRLLAVLKNEGCIIKVLPRLDFALSDEPLHFFSTPGIARYIVSVLLIFAVDFYGVC